MAPKSWPPRRTPKTTARRSIFPPKGVSTLQTSSVSSPSSDSLNNPPPPSAVSTATSPLGSPLNDAGRYSIPKLENSSTTPCSHSQLDAERQEESLVMSSGGKIAVGDKVQEINRANSDSSMAGITGLSKADDKRGVVRSCGDETNCATGPKLDGKGGDEASKVDKAAIGAGEVKKEGESRTRKVMKKKVRIVKKIVKRRVPKSVVKGGRVSEEVERVVEDVGNSNEGNEDTESEKIDPLAAAFTDTENSKLDETVALEIANKDLKEMQLQPMRNVKTSPPIEKESKTIEKVGNLSKNEIGMTEVEKVDPSGTLSGQTETDKADAFVSSQVSSEDDEDLCFFDVSVFGQIVGNGSQGIQDDFKNQDLQFVEMESGDSVKDQTIGPVEERQGKGEEVVMQLVENNGVGVNGGAASSLEAEALRKDGEDIVKEVVKKDGFGFNGGVPLSEEMEALERKKRRRTQVFLGGLDKDAKEEDIRKVFERVGKVTEVRLVMNGNTGKNKGFAFLRFASAADAKTALEKSSTVKICGKQCGLRPVEGNDTLFLGNINKKWKTEDVVKLLKDAKIEKIEKVTVMPDPSNFEQNRGFAFLEFETSKDAQIALSKLQKHDLFINQMKMKFEWAQPLFEPKEEEMLKVKSVYAEYLPPAWDKEKVMNLFKRFGEIETISLAKNLPSCKRKDFAFVNYATREAALACVQAFSHGQVDDEGSKLRVKVSIAKANAKGMQKKQVSTATGKKLNEKRKVSESISKVCEPIKRWKPATSNLEGIRVDRTASATDELLQLLRLQAFAGQTQQGSSNLNYQYALPGNRGPLSTLGSRPLHPDSRGLPLTYGETPYLFRSPSAVSRSVGLVSLPQAQQPRTSHVHETSHGFEHNPRVKMRQQANYFGHNGMYRRD